MDDVYRDPEKRNVVRDTMKKISFHMPRSESSLNRKLAEFESEISRLEDRGQYLEEGSEEISRNLSKTIADFEVLKKKYQKIGEQLIQARRQNEKLTATLEEAKTQINALKEEVEKLCTPPNSYAIFMRRNEDGTLDISLDGKQMKVTPHPRLNLDDLQVGQRLILNEVLNVIDAADFELSGEVVQIKSLLDDGRVIALARGDEERVVHLSEPLRASALEIGDSLMVSSRSGYAYEKLPRSQVEEVVIEEIPDISYADIGGLSQQIEALRDAIELPLLYADEFRRHKLTAPKGILLYGPPGCGKTMLAKAVANSLAKKIAAERGVEAKSFFLNIKGPELLNKYVGETEHRIREVFNKAKRKANENMPVIVYFDEMDSLFRQRGSGISSDVETTIVAQFLSEIDGVESLKNVIVIGASNRQDLIDPAVLRPGRLDVKIRVDRPDEAAARDIFSKYLTPELPYAEDELRAQGEDVSRLIAHYIKGTVERMYSSVAENKFLEVTYARGEKEVFYFKDFSSGAMIESVVSRAKKAAIKRLIKGGRSGICLQDLLDGVRAECRENEDLPNTTNPDDWAKITGRKGERIVHVRSLLHSDQEERRVIEDVNAGQYL